MSMLAPYLLLVEDNQDDVLLTLRTLRVNRCPLIARVVYDGVQALEFLQNAGALPVAILLNASLPRLDGEEVVRLLRGDKRTDHLPIVLVTGNEDECHRLSRSGEGFSLADACLTKPVEWTALRTVLRRLGLPDSPEANLGRGSGQYTPRTRLS